MIEIKLPFGETLFVCEVCGHSRGWEESSCNGAKQLQIPDVFVGKAVIVARAPRTHIGEDPDPKEFVREPYGIRRIFYSHPGELVGYFRGFYREEKILETHTLCVEIAQSRDEFGERAWRLGDTSMSFATLAYADLLLWQEGDKAKLEAAGLFAPPKKSFVKSLLGRR